MEELRQTEFNHSIATLQRIDYLMKILHDTSIDPLKDNNISVYCETVQRLYKEGKDNFSKDEQDQCYQHRLKIAELKRKWSQHLYSPTIPSKRYGEQERINQYYYGAWGEIKAESERFEDFLITCLNKHGMLMIQKEGKGAVIGKS